MPILNSRGSFVVAGTFLSLALLGAGCGASDRLIDTDTGAINVEGTNGNGLSAGEGAQIPADFPAFYPRYPNAKTKLAFTQDGGKSGSLAQETTDTFAQAQAQVEQMMQSQGFTKDNALNSPDVVILTYSKGTTRCQINIVSQSGTTHIQSTCAEQTT